MILPQKTHRKGCKTRIRSVEKTECDEHSSKTCSRGILSEKSKTWQVKENDSNAENTNCGFSYAKIGGEAAQLSVIHKGIELLPRQE